MQKILLIIVLALLSIATYSQNHPVYGTVRDSLSGEALIGATIYVKDINQGVVSNNYGFYSISLPKGSYSVVYIYLGYKSVEQKIDLDGGLLCNVNLSAQAQYIQEVKVSSSKSVINEVGTSRNELTISAIKSIPSVTGEPNVLKALQLLPGIQAANQGLSNLYVRGGNYDQNLIILDEAPVYNPTHALGFFSTFNSDAIKNVEVYKGGFPAQYGGRLSSVVNITMKEGNYNQTKVNAGLGLLASRLSVESPIIKEKASFIISGRYSYAGSVLNIFGGKLGSELLGISALNNFNDNNKVSFYDINAKVNFRVNAKNHVYVSTYTGHDLFYCYPLNSENELEWGNMTNTLRWNHIFSGKLFSNFTAYYSRYNYNSAIKEDIRNYNWKANIQEAGLKYELTYYLNHSNKIKAGVGSVNQHFAPGSISPKDSTSIIESFSLNNKQSFEINGYVSNEQIVNQWLSFAYGLRFSSFMNYGPAVVYNYSSSMETVIDSVVYSKGDVIDSYNSLEPRISARVKLSHNNAIKLAYSFTTQNLHLLSNSSAGLPTDIWIPGDSYIKPKSSHQYVLGYYLTIYSNLEFSSEIYHKKLKNIIDYVDNADLFMNKNIETQIRQGDGYSNGVELLLEKKLGSTTGWLGYTLAKTQYRIADINNNQYYSPRYDIRHNFTAVGNYELNSRWSLSSTFKLASGGFLTTPAHIFEIDGAAFFHYPKRNNFKLPLYHNLDIGASYSSKRNDLRRYKSQWMFALNNVYSQKNVFALYMKQDSYDFLNSLVYKMYLHGIVPSVTYNLSF